MTFLLKCNSTMLGVEPVLDLAMLSLSLQHFGEKLL